MAGKDVLKREVKRMRDWADQHDGQFPPFPVSVLGHRFTVELQVYYLIATPKDDSPTNPENLNPAQVRQQCPCQNCTV